MGVVTLGTLGVTFWLPLLYFGLLCVCVCGPSAQILTDQSSAGQTLRISDNLLSATHFIRLAKSADASKWKTHVVLSLGKAARRLQNRMTKKKCSRNKLEKKKTLIIMPNCLSLFRPKFEAGSSQRGVALGNESSSTSVCQTFEALFSATLANRVLKTLTVERKLH